MSFLTPLYLAGLLALSLPLLCHLFRRIPRGQLPFSSLMFLSPSPPRLTRRSRLDQLLLLFLRVLALCLIALAFARPFLREAMQLDLTSAQGRRVAILVDTSASMQRGDLWSQAAVKVTETLDELSALDRVALFTFDEEVDTLVDFEDGFDVDPGGRAALVRRRLEQVAPTWAGTDLGTALVSVADGLDVFGDTQEFTGSLEIVLVTDLQHGSRLDALQAYQWPPRVQLAVKQVALPRTTNASLQLLLGIDEPDSTESYRVRVTNEADSSRERFELRWASSSQAQPAREAQSVYVPPGRSRVVKVPKPAKDLGADRLVLSGDDQDFDNTLYLAPRSREEVTVRYIGRDRADDPKEMRYYLERALTSGGRFEVRFISGSPDEPLNLREKLPARLVVVTETVSEARQKHLRRYVESGGTVLYVLKDASTARSIAGILGREKLHLEEASVGDYAMLSEIDFAHPIFASFADPRFNDFSKIHFWKHRRLELEAESAMQVLARFDSGDPALIEGRHGRGRLLVLTSGWHPADSQLALSSKFVPLLSGLLEEESGAGLDRPYYLVHDHVTLPGRAMAAQDRTVLKPDGSEVKLLGDARAFSGTDQPGIYQLNFGTAQRRFAVNLSPAESKTTPLALEDLEQHGVHLGHRAEEEDRRRQLRDLELEGRQKLWRWLVAGALGVLILETWLAGYVGRRKGEGAKR